MTRSYIKSSSLVGRKFGMLTCIQLLPKVKGKKRRAIFNCDCGRENFEMSVRSVTQRGKISCGCKRNVSTHGLSNTRTYRIWAHMKRRVSRNFISSHRYFYRGIQIEDKRWYDFNNFYKDMGECPDGYSLERVDNNKGYYKENCCWATRSQQQSNREYSVKGEELKTILNMRSKGYLYREISEVVNRPIHTIYRHCKKHGVTKMQRLVHS